MTRTYVDAGVLIAAVRAADPLSGRALAYLGDPQRSFASSVFVRLEVLPKPLYFKRQNEVAFYDTFFDAVSTWATATPELMEQAYDLAATYGLSAIDALHVASAIALQADELITTEGPGKPIHRVTELTVVSLYSSGS